MMLLFAILGITSVCSIAVLDRSKLWHRKIIPYEIHQYLSDSDVIEETIKYFNTLTCVQWRKRSVDKDLALPYIIFKADSVCRSEVGRTKDSINGQSIYIGSDCNIRSIILHEMYHVMGFYHEMKRFDRDKFVEIHWENIVPGYEKYFQKLRNEETDLLNQEYDVLSLMHYGSFAYSKYKDKKTISVVGNNSEVISEANPLNDKDIGRLKLLYDCRDDASEGWSLWSSYSTCNNTCFKRRSRFCYSRDASSNVCSNNLSEQPTVETEEVKCSSVECRRNGWWSRWSSWNSCNVYCGRGQQHRTRDCTDPSPRMSGRDCTGNKTQVKLCKRGSCQRVKYDCEFDNDGFCYWKFEGDWKRTRAGTSIGPSTDISFITGYYIILTAHLSGTMSLYSIHFRYSCMMFYFYMTSQPTFKISLTYTDKIETTWIVSSNLIGWNVGRLNLIGSSINKIEIYVNVDDGYLALDDIFFSTTSCQNHNVELERMRTTSNTKVTKYNSTEPSSTIITKYGSTEPSSTTIPIYDSTEPNPTTVSTHKKGNEPSSTIKKESAAPNQTVSTKTRIKLVYSVSTVKPAITLTSTNRNVYTTHRIKHIYASTSTQLKDTIMNHSIKLFSLLICLFIKL